MQLTEPTAPLSDSFRVTALAEREKLIESYEAACAQHAALLAQAEEIAREVTRYMRTIRELGELLGIEDQLSMATLTEELRGERLRQIAAEIVFRHYAPGTPFHYRDWLDLVVAEGYTIGGKNPAATFLTQAARVEGVVRVGRRTGMYRVEVETELAA